MDTLSEDILSENPAIAREQRGKPGVIVVGRNAGTGYVAFHHRLGTYRIAAQDVEIGYCALGDFLGRFGNLGLVHLGPSVGHCGLLLSALPQLATNQHLIWLELSAREGTAQADDVCDAFSAEKFEIFAFAPRRDLETGSDAAAGSALDGGEIASLVLVPHRHPNRPGFELLARARTEDDIRAALASISVRAQADDSSSWENEVQASKGQLS